jgi:cellulose 1,4-beta-cellobiosidase
MASNTALTCTVPVTALRASPYSLAWGADVYAKVTAINTYGNSVTSDEGNGAKIITAPEAPTGLANDAGVTSATQIGLTWSAPSVDNGSAVTSYNVLMGTDGSTFPTVVTGVATTSYTATSLTQGTTYHFKVAAVNGYGAGAESSVVQILAAQKPA